MAKQLTAQEITDLLTSTTTRKKKDTSEPRTMDNWWHQTHQIIFRADFEIVVKCSNPDCPDPRLNDRTILLGEVKGTLMCRYCFLHGYLSGI